VDLDDLGLAGVDPKLRETRLESGAERLELLVRIPHHADLEVVAYPKQTALVQAFGGRDAVGLKPGDDIVIAECNDERGFGRVDGCCGDDIAEGRGFDRDAFSVDPARRGTHAASITDVLPVGCPSVSEYTPRASVRSLCAEHLWLR
jgi:hypothetical protein